MEKKVLLLNPPGEKLYIRSNYCSKISKSRFVYEPVDLAVISGIVSERFSVGVLDCIAERLNFEKSLRKIIRLNPDFIITLVGSSSWSGDMSFLNKLKETLHVYIMGSGDELMEDGEEILSRHNFLDAIIFDYTSSEITDYIAGRRTGLKRILFNGNHTPPSPYTSKMATEFEIPVPRHELFPLKKYRFPFVRSLPVASVITDFGCPYACSFCIFANLGFKLRKVKNVLDELNYLTSIGVREVNFGDQSFAANRNRTVSLCESIIDSSIDWSCYSRVDLVDSNLLILFKKAGCHTIIFGVESGNDRTLKRYNKGLTIRDIKATVKLCKDIGIRVVTTFIIGLPGESEMDCENTIRFARELGCDFASFNTPIPRKRTALRKDAKENKWLITDKQDMDQSGNYPSLNTPLIPAARLKQLRDRAERKFYFRPGYIFKRLSAINSLGEFFREFQEGFSVIIGILLRLFKGFN